jgi:hypothetical protein
MIIVKYANNNLQPHALNYFAHEKCSRTLGTKGCKNAGFSLLPLLSASGFSYGASVYFM